MTALAYVLIVHDNADLREALRMLLESKGHRVVEAGDGQAALDRLATDANIDVIILDLMMPVMDGATFLARKAQGVHAGVPVVVFSSAASEEVERTTGLVAVVPKLEGIDGLLAALRSSADLASYATQGAFHV